MNTRTNISHINSITTDDESGPDSIASSRRQSKINYHSISTSNPWNEEKSKPRRLSTVSIVKSSVSLGYRYTHLILIRQSFPFHTTDSIDENLH